ncbi:MAG: polysaccharide biosynthesis C-terminal domain-containing protein [Saprospiraceae bacterium]|nr:polysaccharide biosynthesis C-terminal domain-containing protein [Saprospiraceae bacterium]MBP7699121.1 polysaccharide biosynthesis C-terminal domain-containing protein [Saprospiraceae bacterium]
MGIIIRQSIKQSIVTYAGTLIGMVNILFIYPLVFTPAEQGLFRVLVDVGLLISPLMTLGISGIVVRFFPDFKNETNGHNGYLGSLLSAELCCFFISFLVLLPFIPKLIQLYAKGDAMLLQYLWLAIAIGGISMLTHLFSEYASNFGRIAIPAAINQCIKIMLPTLALLYYFKYISFQKVVYGYSTAFFILLLMMIGYVKSLGQLFLRPNFSFITKGLRKSMMNYSLYAMLGIIGTMLVIRLDAVMVAGMINLHYTGVFTIGAFIAESIAVPSIALIKIAAPIISKAWAENDIGEIKKVYEKSAVVLLMVGLFIFLNIWINIDDVFRIMPNGKLYEAGKYVVLLLGISKLVDMATGVNNEVIGFSKWYNFNLMALLVLAALNFCFNLWLIPLFHINGVALASLLSLFLFNVTKLIFIKVKIGTQPLNRKTILLLLISLLCYTICFKIAPTDMPIVNIILRSIILSILYISAVIYLNISEDVNRVVQNLQKRFISK